MPRTPWPPFLALGAAIVGCRAPVPTPPERGATLVVLITVDQMRSDYLTRFRPQLTAGLDRLLAGGAWFPNAYQDQAVTETAPGHASAWSGRYPRHHGIVSNDQGVPDTTVWLLDSRGPGASPARLRGSSFFDWVRAGDPAARALAVSRKDRSAILSVGRARESVYWFAPEGLFTTSTYYADRLPDWVRAFNARRLPENTAGRVWRPLLPDSVYAEPDSVPIEAGGRDFTFPHVMSADSARAARSVLNWPWMDEITAAFALAGVDALGLGRGPAMDVLAVSFSATDGVGHRFGPDSREIHDQVLRLDRALGVLIDSLYRLVDSSRVVIVLTADHGVAPYPELYSRRTGTTAGHVSLRALITDFRAALAERGVPARAFFLESDRLWVDRSAFARAGVPPDSVVRVFADRARDVPGVARADLVASLVGADTVADAVARRWVHALPADAAIEVVMTIEPHWVWGSGGDAQHGSPWDYDAHVPLVFYGGPFRPGRHDLTVHAVDLVPTLAAALGIPLLEPVDGVVRWEALRSAP